MYTIVRDVTAVTYAVCKLATVTSIMLFIEPVTTVICSSFVKQRITFIHMYMVALLSNSVFHQPLVNHADTVKYRW